jgi:hypothetical protein
MSSEVERYEALPLCCVSVFVAECILATDLRLRKCRSERYIVAHKQKDNSKTCFEAVQD